MVRSARTLSASLVSYFCCQDVQPCWVKIRKPKNRLRDGTDLGGCFEPVVTEDDCTPTQVFTGESCRIMLRPEKLDFGTSEATLQIGTEMQQLTPSFLGDAPREWAVNPQLPDGIEIDLESGVIRELPTTRNRRGTTRLSHLMRRELPLSESRSLFSHSSHFSTTPVA